MAINLKRNGDYNMKKLSKILSLVLITAIISSGVIYQQAEAKDIYFAGQYKMNYGPDEYFLLDMNQYSSPSGKEKGNFTIWYAYKPTGHLNPWYEGTLNKVGGNKYQYKNGKAKMTFRVYKKKVVVSGNKHCDNSMLGTYKLKKRYYS